MLGVIKGGMKANETSSYSLYRTSLEKQIKKIKISRKERKERKERCMPKQEERELWCSPQIVSPPRGLPYQLECS